MLITYLGSVGQCGPNNGPQCQDCAGFHVGLDLQTLRKNRSGVLTCPGTDGVTNYCGRILGVTAIPGHKII